MSLLIAMLFVVVGLAIKHGKMYYLIAGYNSMTKEEQSQYDIEGIATLCRNVMFLMSISILIGFAFSKWLSEPKIEFYTICVTVLLGITILILRTNSNKYKQRN